MLYNLTKYSTMKKTLFILLGAFITISGFSQSEKYLNAMKKNISEIDSALSKGDVAKLTDIAASFERIGNAEKNQWLPFYYAAYCKVTQAFMKNDPEQNDPIADQVDMLLNKADSLENKNSEVSLLKAMNASLRMLVNPMQRWQQYGPVVQQYSKDAMTQDTTNPRPYWFSGVSLKNTPEQFGGGCGTAKPQLDK
ncbi:MAG: hypothetical protein KDF60_19980, partial [Calditrichaeota bacterium]|nr:hypothetical protein [Calditrichota bacterium]